MPNEQAGSHSELGRAATQEMSLRDIPAFDTRKKVANLMAVAPALPIRDLYDLLSNVDGDLVAARMPAIRASQAPSARPAVKRETPTEAVVPHDGPGKRYYDQN
jgi:hypothetical protein